MEPFLFLLPAVNFITAAAFLLLLPAVFRTAFF